MARVDPGTNPVATFSEDVVLKPGGTIIFRNLGDPSGTSDFTITLSDPTESLENRFAVRDGWKLILNTNGNKELYHLYDVSTPVDPHETSNLAASNPQLVSELRWRSSTGMHPRPTTSVRIFTSALVVTSRIRWFDVIWRCGG